MTPSPAIPSEAPDADPAAAHHQRDRLLLLAASVVCCLIIWYAAKAFGIPVHPGFEGSLLQQPAWPLAVLLTMAMFLLCVIVGTVVAGFVRFDAGLFAAAVGLIALSARGNSARAVLLWADSHAGATVYIKLLAEVMLLFVGIGAIWLGVWWARRSGWLKLGPALPESEGPGLTWGQKARAIALQVIVGAVITMFLARYDAKAQVLAAVAIGAYFGAASAEHFYGDAESPEWFWLGPMITAMLGYLFAYLNPAGLQTGQITDGVLARLARPLPLDYASIGTAGALVGYWSGAPVVRGASDMVLSVWGFFSGDEK